MQVDHFKVPVLETKERWGSTCDGVGLLCSRICEVWQKTFSATNWKLGVAIATPSAHILLPARHDGRDVNQDSQQQTRMSYGLPIQFTEDAIMESLSCQYETLQTYF